MARGFHSFFCGNGLRSTRCATINMIREATPKRVTAITSGWETVSATFVAVEAEDHNTAKTNTASIHFNQLCFFCLCTKESGKNTGLLGNNNNDGPAQQVYEYFPAKRPNKRAAPVCLGAVLISVISTILFFLL